MVMNLLYIGTSGKDLMEAMEHIGPWPIFHGPVILPYIIKTLSYMYITGWDNNSV